MALDKFSILIAGSDPNQLAEIQAVFAEKLPKVAIISVTDGRKALQIIETQELNAIVLEANLPSFSGVQIVEELKFIKKMYVPKHIFMICTAEEKAQFEIESLTPKVICIEKGIEIDETYQSIIEGLRPKKKKVTSNSLDVKYMNPFIENTIKVLEVMANVKAQKQTLEIKKDQKFMGDISAYYPIRGSNIEGFFIVSFPKDTYLKVMSEMLFEEFTEINEENQDGVGEICNQVFGNTKAYFNDTFDMQIEMETPAIIIGESHIVVNKNFNARISVTFQSNFGEFYIETALHAKK